MKPSRGKVTAYGLLLGLAAACLLPSLASAGQEEEKPKQQVTARYPTPATRQLRPAWPPVPIGGSGGGGGGQQGGKKPPGGGGGQQGGGGGQQGGGGGMGGGGMGGGGMGGGGGQGGGGGMSMKSTCTDLCDTKGASASE